MTKVNPIVREIHKLLETDETSTRKLHTMIEYCCYFYEFTDLPNPIKIDCTAEMRDFRFSVIDAGGDPYFEKMCGIFKLDRLSENRINMFLAYLKFISDSTTAVLQPEFKYFRLDFRVLVIIIYRLIGKDNFMTVFRQSYPHCQAKYFDVIFYDLFLKIVESTFKGLQCNIRFTAPETQPFQPTQPRELHSLLQSLFPLNYQPSPLRFLFSMCKAYNCANLIQVSKKMEQLTLEQENMELETETLLQQAIYFNIFRRRKTTAARPNLDRVQSDYKLFAQSRLREKDPSDDLYCRKNMVAHLEKNDREDEEHRYLNNLLIKKDLLVQEVDDGRLVRKYTPLMEAVKQKSLANSSYGVAKSGDRIVNENREFLNYWVGPVIVNKEVQDVEEEINAQTDAQEGGEDAREEADADANAIDDPQAEIHAEQ